MSARRAIGLLAALGAATALAVSGTGCGASGPAAIDPVAQAAKVTSHVSGAHFALSAQLNGFALARPFTITGQGYFNASRLEGKLEFQASGLPASAAASLPGGALHVDALFKYPSIYLGGSLFASPLLQGKLHGAHWMKLDLSSFSQALGINLFQPSGTQASPSQFLQYLEAAGGTPELLGSDVIRGVQATHYRATIDLNRIPSVLRASLASRLRAQIPKLIAQMGTSKIPVDVWIDSQHMLRRISLDISISTGEQHAQLKLSLDLFEYGPTPRVQPPPAREVFDATQLALAALGKPTG
jgi:hypothetical protein